LPDYFALIFLSKRAFDGIHRSVDTDVREPSRNFLPCFFALIPAWELPLEFGSYGAMVQLRTPPS